MIWARFAFWAFVFFICSFSMFHSIDNASWGWAIFYGMGSFGGWDAAHKAWSDLEKR